MQRPQQYEYEQNQPQQPMSVYQQDQPVYQQPNQPQYQQPNPPQYQQPQTVYAPQMQVVVNQPATQQPQPTVVSHQVTYQKDKSPNHCLHCIITFFCPLWIFVWICLCCINGC